MAMAEAKRIAPSREGSPQLRLSIRTAYARRLDRIVRRSAPAVNPACMGISEQRLIASAAGCATGFALGPVNES